MPRFDRRPHGRVWIAAVLLIWGLAAGSTAAQEAGSETEETISFPVYLDGIDLDLPAPEAFREWPDDSLLARPYWLPWGFTVVRTGEESKSEAGARLSREGSEVRVGGPEELRAEARRLTGAIESEADGR